MCRRRRGGASVSRETHLPGFMRCCSAAPTCAAVNWVRARRAAAEGGFSAGLGAAAASCAASSGRVSTTTSFIVRSSACTASCAVAGSSTSVAAARPSSREAALTVSPAALGLAALRAAMAARKAALASPASMKRTTVAHACKAAVYLFSFNKHREALLRTCVQGCRVQWRGAEIGATPPPHRTLCSHARCAVPPGVALQR